MTQFVNKTFSVHQCGDQTYRDNWERTFGTKDVNGVTMRGNVCQDETLVSTSGVGRYLDSFNDPSEIFHTDDYNEGFSAGFAKGKMLAEDSSYHLGYLAGISSSLPKTADDV